MKHYLILMVLLLAAGAFYAVGMVTGAVALSGIGMVLELTFWFGLFRGAAEKRSPVRTQVA